jgi:hypothetical protein
VRHDIRPAPDPEEYLVSSPFGTPDRPFGTPRSGPVGKRRRTGLVIGLVSLPVTVLFFPVGLVLGVLAIVTSIRALRKGGPTIVGRAVTALLAGAFSTVLALLCFALIIGLWPQYKTFTSCQNTAVTIQDKNVCQNQFRSDIEHRFGFAPNSIPRVH